MKEFVLQIKHLHSIPVNLTTEDRLKRRWFVQWYLPELKISHLEERKGDEFFVKLDTAFRISRSPWTFDFGFVLFGFGLGISRKTDRQLKQDTDYFEKHKEQLGRVVVL